MYIKCTFRCISQYLVSSEDGKYLISMASNIILESIAKCWKRCVKVDWIFPESIQRQYLDKWGRNVSSVAKNTWFSTQNAQKTHRSDCFQTCFIRNIKKKIYHPKRKLKICNTLNYSSATSAVNRMRAEQLAFLWVSHELVLSLKCIWKGQLIVTGLPLMHWWKALQSVACPNKTGLPGVSNCGHTLCPGLTGSIGS